MIRCEQQGFTLIEIMVVVLLIGLIATGASVMFDRGGPEDVLYDEVSRFTIVAQRISDQAVLSGEAMGLVLTPPSWADDAEETRWHYKWKRFVTLPDSEGLLFSEWQDLEGWEPVALDAAINVAVRRDGSQWEWQAVPANETPIFVLYPSGEADPYVFEVEFAHDQAVLAAQHVELDVSGRLQWREARQDRDELIGRLQ